MNGYAINCRLQTHEGAAGTYKRKTHKVEPGDTLNAIAKKYNISSKVIADLNNLKHPYTIYPGNWLKIVGPKSNSSKPKNSSSASTMRYKVKSGDVLSVIAQRFNRTVDEIARANNIKHHDEIKAGQTLIIPKKREQQSNNQKPKPKKNVKNVKKERGKNKTPKIVVRSKKAGGNCPSGEQNCFCTQKLTPKNGFFIHPRIKKHHTPTIERSAYKKQIKYVVLHRTVNYSAKQTFTAFSTKRGKYYYGTHFVVGKDGSIYQTANLKNYTIHVKGHNSHSIGIEVVGMPIDKNGKPTMGGKGRPVIVGWQPLTEIQAKSVACLTNYLLRHYGLSKSSALQVHEDLAPKTKGEGRVVYDAIKKYLD